MLTEETQDNLRSTFKESLLILIYEFMGAALMTILFINTCQNKMIMETIVSKKVTADEKTNVANKDAK
jgi:hypothetical protein